MSSFTYNSAVPAPNDDPSADQPVMQINAASIASIIAVDHVGFNTSPGGTHNQVTFSSENTPSTPSDPSSVLYTAAGTASPVASLQYVNANATFPINLIKAWAMATSAGLVSGQSFNVTSVTRNSTGTYTVVIPANVCTGTNYAVIATCTPTVSIKGIVCNYTILSATSFQLFFAFPNVSAQDPTGFNFMVIQL